MLGRPLPGSPGPATGTDSDVPPGSHPGAVAPPRRFPGAAAPPARSLAQRARGVRRRRGPTTTKASSKITSVFCHRHHLRGCHPPPPPPPQSCDFRFPQVRAITSGSLKIIAQTAKAAATITPRSRNRNDEPDRRNRPPQSYNSRFPHPFTTTWGDLSGPSHYYGVSYGPIHVVSLNNYLPYAPGTPQASPPTHPPTLPLPHQPTTHPEA